MEPATEQTAQETPAQPEPVKIEVEAEKATRPEPVVEEVKKPEPQEVKEELKQPEIKAEDIKPEPMEEKKQENPDVQSAQKKEDEVFKIRPTEFKSKINVVGQMTWLH